MPEPSLMELSHGGGCGCKVAPAALKSLLPTGLGHHSSDYPDLLVGNETADDCAAWLLDDDIVVVSSTDFFMPVVNNPYDFGRIAATNALSDIYAMGAQPIFALALVGMPLGKLAPATITAVLAGGRDACAAATVPVAGGHTIDTSEPLYGLAVTGRCTRQELCRNSTAQAGDTLILTKPLGIGILSAALRRAELTPAALTQLVTTTTMLNKPGRDLAQAGLVSAMTDVTGFGLLGHTLEMCRGANLQATLHWPSLPLLTPAVSLAQEGYVTGASARNWQSYSSSIKLQDCQPWQQALLTDPQTSGGLLLACPDAAVADALRIISAAGFNDASVIGTLTQGPAQVTVVLEPLAEHKS